MVFSGAYDVIYQIGKLWTDEESEDRLFKKILVSFLGYSSSFFFLSVFTIAFLSPYVYIYLYHDLVKMVRVFWFNANWSDSLKSQFPFFTSLLTCCYASSLFEFV